MDFRLTRTLAENAALKVAIHLWYHIDVWNLMDGMEFNRCMEYEITAEVIANLRMLPTAEAIKQQIANYVGQLKHHICEWIGKQQRLGGRKLREVNLTKTLSWTSFGTIDQRRTAEKLINSSVLDTTFAFRLACFNCLEHHITKLWSEVHASNFPHVSIEDIVDIYGCQEVIFWIGHLNKNMKLFMRCVNGMQEDGNEWSKDKVLYCAFLSGIFNGNREFVNYFIQRLDASIFLETMEHCADFMLEDRFNGHDKQALLLVLSHLNDKVRNKLFEKHQREVLFKFLNWPSIHFFNDVAERVFHCIDAEIYFAVLEHLALIILNYIENVMLERIFVNFWEKSPQHLKRYVLSDWIFDKYINVILSSSDPKVKTAAEATNLSERLSEALFSNALALLDIFKGFCCWETLQTVIPVCIITDSAVGDFLAVIRKIKVEHGCGEMCSPQRFHKEVCRIIYDESWGTDSDVTDDI